VELAHVIIIAEVGLQIALGVELDDDAILRAEAYNFGWVGHDIVLRRP
jgi:hypothetical protein